LQTLWLHKPSGRRRRNEIPLPAAQRVAANVVRKDLPIVQRFEKNSAVFLRRRPRAEGAGPAAFVLLRPPANLRAGNRLSQSAALVLPPALRSPVVFYAAQRALLLRLRLRVGLPSLAAEPLRVFLLVAGPVGPSRLGGVEPAPINFT